MRVCVVFPIAIVFFLFDCVKGGPWGLPTGKNYTPERTRLGSVAGFNPPECNGEPPPGVRAFVITLNPAPGKFKHTLQTTNPSHNKQHNTNTLSCKLTQTHTHQTKCSVNNQLFHWSNTMQHQQADTQRETIILSRAKTPSKRTLHLFTAYYSVPFARYSVVGH